MGDCRNWCEQGRVGGGGEALLADLGNRSMCRRVGVGVHDMAG